MRSTVVKNIHEGGIIRERVRVGSALTWSHS